MSASRAGNGSVHPGTGTGTDRQSCEADAAKQLDERHRGVRHAYASVIPMALPSASASDATRTG
ncbi:hypothetical protein XFF6992_570011 [Xanthomonas citri pv. fuscans]|uniref:Uncharacterized protein n=1 Tax=Xanthomonas campestris pv. phaseoli TaxID=317013 RepID=A0A7Z7NGU3_XANCH|nr:hypothetical protein XFF6990_420054 [Xanthomonas citri pv. fuscans]SOO21437.1 hypothetical protein XFF6992_570011 [Xanthomonas citri pv. fuscans]SOO23011.1 hypothetical protein XFF6991_180119 [Xanthomonas phaseoli pv. phaseoli]SOO35607.1 hypothetical protein XFF6994_5480024 [Xanthomonas citri pv. fuscans]